MDDKVNQMSQTTNSQNQADGRKTINSLDCPQPSNFNIGIVTRERSFIRTSNQQNINKRRSLAFNVQSSNSIQGQLRGRPAMDIYRPPSVRSDGINSIYKLNANAQEFTMILNTQSTKPEDTNTSRSPMVYATSGGANHASQSKSASLNQMQYIAVTNAANRRHTAGMTTGHSINHRPILLTHSQPVQFNNINRNVSHQIPLLNSPSSGNILYQTTNSTRVKFANEPQKLHNKNSQVHISQNYQSQNNTNQFVLTNNNINSNGVGDLYSTININPLQRSKSLSSADAFMRGIAGLGLGLGNEITDIGQFTPETQALIDTALEDPNKLNSRCLMELTSHFIRRAVEGRRYALPISRLCLNIIAKEQKLTFLEALLNTCRQWYQEREKLLFAMQGMKSPSRVRLTAFMAFLTEMFCQLKRRQLQQRTHCEGAPPPLVLLTLLSKCCEDCVTPPVRSLSETECLFYVLTCIGQDMEMQLPQQLEILLSLVRDAFLNASDSAPSIRRTLLQLIELQASHWQLPGNTVLYYYPSAK